MPRDRLTRPPADPLRLVAYYRVSTQRQGASGLGLEAQQAAVRAWVERAGASVQAEFTEVESGRRRVSRRPRLAEALDATRTTRATLVVAKLDRLSRDARLLLELVDSGLAVRFLDFPDLDPTTAVGRLSLTVMAAFAEFESRRTGERIVAALQSRRVRGTRPSACQAAARLANRSQAGQYRDEVRGLLDGLRADGLSLSRMCERLNRAGHRTRSGRPWKVQNLSRLLVSLDAFREDEGGASETGPGDG